MVWLRPENYWFVFIVVRKAFLTLTDKLVSHQQNKIKVILILLLVYPLQKRLIKLNIAAFYRRLGRQICE